MNELKILLIGCGKMGSSLLEGIVKSDNFDGIVDVIEPVIQNSLKEDFKESKVNFYSDIRENKDAINYDLIIIATKPNIYEEIFFKVAHYFFSFCQCNPISDIHLKHTDHCFHFFFRRLPVIRFFVKKNYFGKIKFNFTNFIFVIVKNRIYIS